MAKEESELEYSYCTGQHEERGAVLESFSYISLNRYLGKLYYILYNILLNILYLY